MRLIYRILAKYLSKIPYGVRLQMLSYRTDHPNHAHQLVITVSKHYFAAKDGTLKYQKKPMEVSLNKMAVSEKRHMIIYSLRDHCSAVFYAEISFAPEIIEPQAFLSRAWGAKDDFPFQGIPKLLTLPRTVVDNFPELSKRVTDLGIELVNVTSGFQGGIRDIRTIESTLLFSINKPTDDAKDWLEYSCRAHSKDKSRVAGMSKIQLWLKGVPDIRTPPPNWSL